LSLLALDFVEAAAEEIGVKTAEMSLEAGDAQAILNRLNDLLFEWRYMFLTPRFEELLNLQQVVAVDAEANGAIKFNLAVRCAPTFQKVITPGLSSLAISSKETLMIITTQPIDVAYPDTLPIGSGNQCFDFNNNRRFYPRIPEENF